jgi:hypothetical protein
MNIKGKPIEMILGEIRQRHTGKDPFGVATDLKELLKGIEPERQADLDRRLTELEAEPFWTDFIRMARQITKR